MPRAWPSPCSALGLLFCKMRSMCWDVCNLLHAVFPPWGHTHPHKPRHTMTHSDTCWRPAPRAQPALGDAPVTHTLLPLRSHPHPGRSRCSRRAPPAGRGGASVLRSPRRAGKPQRAGRDELTPPPARPPRPNSLQMPAAPRPDLRRGPALGRPLQGAGSGLREGRAGRSGGPGAGGCPPGKGRTFVPAGILLDPAHCLSLVARGGLREGCPARSRVAPRPQPLCRVAVPPTGSLCQNFGIPVTPRPYLLFPATPGPTTRYRGSSLPP